MRAVKLVGAGLAIVLSLTAVVTVWEVVRAPIAQPRSPLVVNDITQLNPITEATLDLVSNLRVKRRHDVMPITAYRDYFFRELLQSMVPTVFLTNCTPLKSSSFAHTRAPPSFLT